MKNIHKLLLIICIFPLIVYAMEQKDPQPQILTFPCDRPLTTEEFRSFFTLIIKKIEAIKPTPQEALQVFLQLPNPFIQKGLIHNYLHYLRETTAWKVVHTIPLENTFHTLRCAEFSPDRLSIATISEQYSACVWDTRTGTCRYTLPSEACAAHFSPDGNYLVTYAQVNSPTQACVYEAETGVLKYMLPITALRHAAFSPDGTALVTACNDNNAYIWDMATGQLQATLQGHTDIVNAATFSPTGAHVVTASDDTTACVWDARTGDVLLTLCGHTFELLSAHFSHDGTRIITSSLDGTARVWDAQTGALVYVLKPYSDEIPDTVVTSSLTGARMNDMRQRNKLAVATQGISTDDSQPLFLAQFSPDDTHIITSTYPGEAYKVTLWKSSNGHHACTFFGPPYATTEFGSVHFSSDNHHIMVPATIEICQTSVHNVLLLWDIHKKELAAHLDAHTNTILATAFSLNGVHILTVGADNMIHIYGQPAADAFVTAYLDTDKPKA